MADKEQSTEPCIKSPSAQGLTMSKARIIKNLIVICLIFLFLYSAFVALTNLQSTLNREGNIGVIAQSVIYAACILSSLFLSSLTIKLGLKNAIVITTFGYVPYISANFYPDPWILITSAAILGFANATLSIAFNSYINELSFLYADEDYAKAKPVTTKFFSIYLMTLWTSHICGNSVSFFVLGHSNSELQLLSVNESGVFHNSTDEIFTCGAEYCGGITQKLQLPSQGTRNLLVGIYVMFAVVAGLIAAFFLDPLIIKSKTMKTTDSLYSKVKDIYVQLINIDQLLLALPSMLIGLHMGLIVSDFTKAYIGCAWGIHNIGLVFVFYGAISAVFCGLQSCFANHLPRIFLITSAAICNIIICITLLYWTPSGEHPLMMFIAAGFLSYCGTVWETQMMSLHGVLFRNQTEAAFANFKLLTALGFSIAYGSSSVLCMSSKIYLNLSFVSVSIIGYLTVELRQRIWKKGCTVSRSM